MTAVMTSLAFDIPAANRRQPLRPRRHAAQTVRDVLRHPVRDVLKQDRALYDLNSTQWALCPACSLLVVAMRTVCRLPAAARRLVDGSSDNSKKRSADPRPMLFAPR